MENWCRDAAHAVRQLMRSPAFTTASVLTLAIAIGAGAAIFALFDALVNRPARILDRSGVYYVAQVSKFREYSPLVDDQVRALRADLPESAGAMLAVTSARVVVQRVGAAERTSVQLVEGDYSTVFRIAPQAGRLFTATDFGAGSRVAVVSDRLWRSWYAGRRDVLGATSVVVNEESFTVIGVMPRGFAGMQNDIDLWLPAAALPMLDGISAPGPWSVYVRERPGADPDQLAAEISGVVSTVASPIPGAQPRIFPAEDAPDLVRWRLSQLRPQMYGAVALLLLAACANLANMLYGRVTQRAGETAVRLALGAGPMAVVRIFAVEIMVIAASGGVLGFAMALWGTNVVARSLPLTAEPTPGFQADLTPGMMTIVFVGVAIGIVTLLLSASTAWQVGRVPPMRHLAAAGSTGAPRSSRRFRVALVSVQVTVAVVLVLGCGLLLISARSTLNREIDFSGFAYPVTGLASASVDLSYHGYNEVRGRAFQAELLAEVRRLPGIEGAALTTGLPGGASGRGGVEVMHFMAAEIHGQRSGQERRMDGTYAAVSEGFPRMAGLEVRAGRPFGAADRDGAPLVALVTENVASVLWPRGDAIGRHVVFSTDRKPREVVGVIANPLIDSLPSRLARRNALVLVPLAQEYRPDIMLLLRSPSASAAAEAASATVHRIDPTVATFHAAAAAVSALGALAVLFAALGIYGVVTFFVSTRLREFGIRRALGATSGQINRLVFDEALHLLLVGLLCGVFVTAVGERILQHNLGGMMPNAVATWAVAICLVLVTGLLAASLPARRAGRVDPNVALREL